MSTKARYAVVFLGICVLLLCSVGAYVVRRHTPAQTAGEDTLLLLLPDSTNASEPMVQIWMDAASEEGLHLSIVRDSDLLSPTFEVHGAGIIVPDELHRIANDALIGALYQYVQHGGKLMLVYDAGTWNLHGAYAGAESRLSELAGVRYALYDTYADKCISWSDVWGSADSMHDLGIAPGKFVPLAGREHGLSRVSVTDTSQSDFTLARYQYGNVSYPSYRTDGNYSGNILLHSKAGLAAGYRPVANGGVLFINLPLGYLADRTDGLLLHSFLHYYAVDILHLPYLAPVPDGVGGLVLNWHIDTRANLAPLRLMRGSGLFSQGPFSEHITAGPDVDWPHDGHGFNLPGSPEAQQWVRFFADRGDAVGSHGGWIHNFFGEHVNDHNEEDFEPYLERNFDALKQASGSAPREYSSPLGNHPAWVTHWLENRGFVAYYFAGNSGMGPTQVWRDGIRDGSNIWAFPILHMGRNASFEEMQSDHVPAAIVRDWLVHVADYVADDHVIRLVYSHPVGSNTFIPVLQRWFQHTAALRDRGQFRWYTMSHAADFLNSRKQVSWAVVRHDQSAVLEAEHPSSLAHQTWMFPRKKYGQPQIVIGRAAVRNDGEHWIVAADDCKDLKVTLEESGH